MTFRAEIEERADRLVVRLAGRFDRQQAPELLALCARAAKPVHLDLADLVSADETGLETLGLLKSRGARLTGASPYLALRLEADVTGRTRPAPECVVPKSEPQRPGIVHSKTEDR